MVGESIRSDVRHGAQSSPYRDDCRARTIPGGLRRRISLTVRAQCFDSSWSWLTLVGRAGLIEADCGFSQGAAGCTQLTFGSPEMRRSRNAEADVQHY